MSKRTIVGFCILVYALGWGVQLGVVAAYGNPEHSPSHWLLLTMMTPAIATLLFAVFSADARRAIRWKPDWRMLPLAVLAVVVPTLIAFSVIAAVDALGWGKAGWFVFSAEGVQISGGPWRLGQGSQDWATFAANVLITGAYFAGLSTWPAIGEELGWRGFLQGLLIEHYGTTRGVVLLGLIWSFWHLPSLLAGYNYPDHPALGGFVLFPLQLVAISMFMAWLTIRSGSFWVAALAHGAGNSIEIGVISNLKMNVPQLYADLLHLAVTVLVGLIFWALLVRRQSAKA